MSNLARNKKPKKKEKEKEKTKTKHANLRSTILPDTVFFSPPILFCFQRKQHYEPFNHPSAANAKSIYRYV